MSDREVDVLRLVATGAGNKEIAQKLFISPNTVRVHLRNIFSKIGAASRTEAAMYAIQWGLVDMPNAPQGDQTPAGLTAPETDGLPAPKAHDRRPWLIWAAVAVPAVVLLSVAALWLAGLARPATPPAPTAAPAPPHWQVLAGMPTARSGLAAAAYDDQIYAIGGETAQDVTGVNERYDPPTNSWETLAAKPVPVTNISAAVIGGRIFIPGGQLASGQITNTLEVYSPRDNRWQELAPLPAAVSAYALTTFEGRLYVFGGWDGEKYQASVFRYAPDTNQWTQLTPMPTARGYAGAAVAGGRIYVMGGASNTEPVAVNEVYIPEQEGQPGGSPWQTRAPLPAACSPLQAADIADNIYVTGSAEGSKLANFAYLSSADAWQTFQGPPDAAWTGAALVALDNSLHLLGGKDSTTLLARHQVYQALFTVFIPIVR